MQQIADWLDELGLGQYAQRFAENGIDVSVLHRLTDEEFEKIGVSLGHRRKLLAAIRRLRGRSLSRNEPVELKSQDTAERRQVTVMFSDLADSTALSARMDPEDLREVISAYHKCVAATVVRFGGFIAQYMGDSVLVYFGYPEAHEDDVERAVRAGLELIAAVTALRAPVSLQTRVGIATGLVVIGDLIGPGEAQKRGVVGVTPNLAARLQGIAEPNTVVIAESTRKLLGNLFELEDLGQKDLKGIVEPVRAWRAHGPASVESRFEALHSAGLTELVGREEELERLLRHWSRAKSGHGHVVLFSGEAGIGKSRLTIALKERIQAQPHTGLSYFCSPHEQETALYPFVARLMRAVGLRRSDTPQQRLTKLEAVLSQVTNDLKEVVPIVADLLSIPTDDRYSPLQLTAHKRKEETLRVLLAEIEALSARQPVLMTFEDAHWIDPTSLELLDLLIDRIPSHPVLLIITFRHEFRPTWIGRPHVSLITLNRLPPRQCVEMIALVTRRQVTT